MDPQPLDLKVSNDDEFALTEYQAHRQYPKDEPFIKIPASYETHQCTCPLCP